jgi:Holliday junction DNA helicase RuvA
MIGFLRGQLVQKHPPALVVDVGGVGYELEAPMSTFYSLPAVGAEVRLHTHLVIREDAHLLYGFATESERRLFRDLLRVSGVGPKIGLALLSGMNVETFLVCVEAQDVESLVRVPGIGRKTAERLLVEMRDRIRALGEGTALPGAAGVSPGAGGSATAEAYAAMVALGYRPAEVTRLLKNVKTDGVVTEEIIREALKLAVSK